MVPNNNYKALFTKLDPFIFIVIINESPERTILILYFQQTYEILLYSGNFLLLARFGKKSNQFSALKFY